MGTRARAASLLGLVILLVACGHRGAPRLPRVGLVPTLRPPQLVVRLGPQKVAVPVDELRGGATWAWLDPTSYRCGDREPSSVTGTVGPAPWHGWRLLGLPAGGWWRLEAPNRRPSSWAPVPATGPAPPPVAVTAAAGFVWLSGPPVVLVEFQQPSGRWGPVRTPVRLGPYAPGHRLRLRLWALVPTLGGYLGAPPSDVTATVGW